MILYIIPILTGATLIAAAAGIYQLQIRNRRVSDRLQRVVDVTAEETEDLPGGLINTSLPLLLRPIAMFSWLLPTQIYSETLQWELCQAGFRHSQARKVFVGARVLTTTAFGLLAVYVTWSLRLQTQEIFILSALGTIFGYFIPAIWMRSQQSKRQEDITLTLPDALDLLVICVEAGQGLNAALLKVGNEMAFQAKALSDELKTVNNEMRAGNTRTLALRNFALRTGVDDVRALVAVMIQSDKFGTSIAQALRIHSDSLRTRRRQRAEERARKTPVKLVFPLVFCIFPELLVVILAPGMLELFRALSKMAAGG